jgi:rubrerythrin
MLLKLIELENTNNNKKMIEKECRQCKVSKTIDNFYKKSDWKYWVMAICKECSQDNYRTWYKSWNNSPHNRKELKEWDNIWPFSFIRETWTKNLKRYIEIKCFCWKSKITTLYVAENSKSCGCLNVSKRNPKRAEQVRIISANRRWKIKSTSDWTINIKATQELLENQGWVCNLCWVDITDRNSRHLDHIIPISKGWPHSIDNVQWLCASCNLSKSDKLL